MIDHDKGTNLTLMISSIVATCCNMLQRRTCLNCIKLYQLIQFLTWHHSMPRCATARLSLDTWSSGLRRSQKPSNFQVEDMGWNPDLWALEMSLRVEPYSLLYLVIYYVENRRDLQWYEHLWKSLVIWEIGTGAYNIRCRSDMIICVTSCAYNTMDGIDVVFGCVRMHLVGHATIVHLERGFNSTPNFFRQQKLHIPSTSTKGRNQFSLIVGSVYAALSTTKQYSNRKIAK